MTKRLATALVVAVGLLLLPAGAIADLIWDNNGATAPNPQDGDGTWDTTLFNWWTGSTNVAWSNSSPTVAQLGNATSTTNKTITVDSGGVTATGLMFKRSYTLQTGPVALSGTSAVVGFVSGTTSATTATINSNLTVTDGNSGTADDLILRGASATLSSSYWKFVLGGSNTYSGKLTLENGALCDVFSTTALGGTEIVVNNGTTVRINTSSGTFGAGQTLKLSGYGFGNSGNLHASRAALMFAPGPSGSLTWAGDVVLDANSSIASTQTNPDTVNTISGDISGIGKLTKNSDKTLALTGTCTYSGGTDIYRSALQVDGTLGTAASTITVGTGTSTDATLKGTGVITGNVVVNAVGNLEAGDSVGTLTVNGNVTVNGKFNIQYDSALDAIDKLVVDGNLNLSAATMSFADVAAPPETLSAVPHVLATYTGTLTQPTAAPTGVPEGFTIAWAYNGNSIALVPEPAAFVLLMSLGLLAVAGRRAQR
jgi:autotransporter-associated beta strand protein